MSGTSGRHVAGPEKFVFDERIDTLRVRIVNGAVNVVGADDGPARVEITELDGPPLKVRLEDGTLSVGYDDLEWKGFTKWWDRRSWSRHAEISLAVPQETRVEVGVVGANAVVSGISGATSVQGVNGDATLVGLSGPVKAHTVGGNVEAQCLSGDLRFSTVSGNLTVVDGAGREVRADTVSGNIVLDLDPSTGGRVRLTTVSGEIALRIPEPGDAEVDANTTSGNVFCAFDELRVSGGWGAKRITGTIGRGTAQLKATTVSGSLALLRRPPVDDPAGPSGPDGTGGPEGDAPSLRKDL
ncbi:hypothetical protein RVR_6887 [Actinacidiphila reveromycinica]|uniref:DUF4097 domain-containing protein n=1 Tax=Actinacidiphila reveromycinica TaxID=659352 RepID=A0A7U3VQP4_9ACTN|nr:DUF4097 family beta strand repeat-containing protein [Streptomyces sp. SN-593]BBB00018.1 hypothetical protein RVR_6887 [Streptomyces sp. SN-593]